MAKNNRPNQVMPLDELFSQLLEEHGLPKRFETFEGTFEGKMLPGNIPYESGMLLLEDGRVFTWWLDWDPDKTAPDGSRGWYTLGEKDGFFREIASSPEEYDNPKDYAFLGAKRQLNLPMAEEELNILRERWKDFPERRRELRLD